MPIQIDDVELIYASLTPFEAGIATLQGQTPSLPGHCAPASTTPITGCNQLGAYKVGQTVHGYELKDTWHFDVTATQVFANVFKASQAVLIFEAGADYVPGLEDKLTGGPQGFGLRYDGAGTNLSGNPNLGGYPEFPAVNGQCVQGSYRNPLGQCFEPGSTFATTFAWGYVVAGRLEYDNAIGEWNLLPHFTWVQDVNGVSPGPGGAFVNGRIDVTMGLTASLHNRWEFDVSYSNYGGAGQYNLLNDRDFSRPASKCRSEACHGVAPGPHAHWRGRHENADSICCRVDAVRSGGLWRREPAGGGAARARSSRRSAVRRPVTPTAAFQRGPAA